MKLSKTLPLFVDESSPVGVRPVGVLDEKTGFTGPDIESERSVRIKH